MTCTVRQVTYQDVKPFVLGIHYARRMPCVQYAYGLFEEDKLLGVVTFGQPASPWLCRGVAGEENRKNVIELNRLVFLPEANGKNHASMLVGKALKMLPRGLFVVSYADWGGVASRRLRLSGDELPVYGPHETPHGYVQRKRALKAQLRRLETAAGAYRKASLHLPHGKQEEANGST